MKFSNFSRRSALLVLVFAAALFFCSPLVAEGYVYKVKPGGTGDGSTWEKALGEQGLLEKLATAGYGHEFWIAAGTYRPYIAPQPSDSTPKADTDPREFAFVLNRGVALYGGFAGTETARSQRDWSRNTTVLSGYIELQGGASTNSYSVVVVSADMGLPAILDGFTIAGGRADGEAALGNGGGIRISDSHTRITNCTFTGNQATRGGGVFISGGAPVIRDTTFAGNAADLGGGIYNEESRLSVSDCIFSNNQARSGGALLNNAPVEESASYGIQSVSSTITKTTFSGNIATESGGAMANWKSSPTVTHSTFSANRSLVEGGALFNSESAPSLTSCTFSSNFSVNGGAVSNWDSSPVIVNCTFFSNRASSSGGALLNDKSSPIVVNSTFTRNRASTGGGMFNFECSPVVANSILWGNGTEIRAEGGTMTVSYSIVEGGFNGERNLDADPLLGPLLNNGGTTETCALDPKSPAIDAGLFVGFRVSGSVIVPLTDQRGTARPKGAGVDIGAYEYFDETNPPAPIGGGGSGGCRSLAGGAESLLLLLPLALHLLRRRSSS